MGNDLISVLIPAYNVEKYLGRCLRSVIKQTYQNLEIVVVDDGSFDGTNAIAQKYAKDDARIILYKKVNEGNVAKTRNFLLDHCHGKYCVWVDSDDCVKPRYIEKLYQAMITHEADMSICNYAVRVIPFPVLSMFYNNVREYEGDKIIPQVMYKTGFMLWNKMYRLDLINGENPVRFDPKYCYGEDLLFNLNYLQCCQKIVCLSTRLYVYSWRVGSEMHKKFSNHHIDFINKLLELCEMETNTVVCDTIRGWTAFSCCGLVYLADKRNYYDAVEYMKQFAYKYRTYLYKNHLVKPMFKFILWLGLKTWCKPKKRIANNRNK